MIGLPELAEIQRLIGEAKVLTSEVFNLQATIKLVGKDGELIGYLTCSDSEWGFSPPVIPSGMPSYPPGVRNANPSVQ
jgi:hypothetical protein